jgi:hypothetical protein
MVQFTLSNLSLVYYSTIENKVSRAHLHLCETNKTAQWGASYVLLFTKYCWGDLFNEAGINGTCTPKLRCRNNSGFMATGWTVRVRHPAWGKRLISRSALWPTQLSIQYVPGALFLCGWSDQGVKLLIHLHLVPRSRMVELYLHSPIRLHGVVLN